MRHRSLIYFLIAVFILTTTQVDQSEARFRIPGAQIFQVVTIVFGMKARRDTYRLANRLFDSRIFSSFLGKITQELHRKPRV